MTDNLWLPTGHHWGLHILHYQDTDAGAFTGGGSKLCWHTTESDWMQEDAMVNVLDRKNDAPHFVIGGRKGLQHPVVTQMVPLNRAGRALANDPNDGKQTNRANCIQVEICEHAANMKDFQHLRALANLFVLITHRRPIPNLLQQQFGAPHRMSDAAWVDAQGHVGHSMAPDNDHVDPGALDGRALVALIHHCPTAGYAL